MKYLGTITVVLLFLFCTIAAPAYAQDQREEAKPPQQEEPKAKEEPKPKESKPQEAKPDNRAQDQQVKEQKDQAKEQEKHQQNEAKHQQEDQSKQQPKNEEPQKQARDDQKRKDDDANRAQKDQDKQQKDQNRQQARASSPNDQNDRNHGQRSNQRIPDEKFRASFGREHHFHVGHPVIVENRPRFQSSGYWFEFVDAWPAGWSYDDDCYIDYVDDGYFLFDPIHPGVRIALTVVF